MIVFRIVETKHVCVRESGFVVYNEMTAAATKLNPLTQ